MVHRLSMLVLGLWFALVANRSSGQEVATQVEVPAVADNADWRAEGAQGAVVAGGRDAVAAGLEILKKGGNAADSATATIVALSVTDSRSFCFGGEVPILVFDAQRRGVTVIAGQGAAPRLATLDHFKRLGSIPARGIEAAAVPAALDACLTLLDRFGTMTFTQVIAPTQALLQRPARPAAWHADLAHTLEILVGAEAQAHSNGSASLVGDRSRGLRLVADAFYRGPIAHRIDAWSSAHGGLIRYVDLATHSNPSRPARADADIR
jgi:gamma-glutamyltranspeptidase / glutathione hydrolase